MKRISFILALMLSLPPCSYAQGKINIFTTTSDLKSIAEFIGGDRVNVDSMAKGCRTRILLRQSLLS